MNPSKLLLLICCCFLLCHSLCASETKKLISLYLDSGDVELMNNNAPEVAMKYALWAQKLYDNNRINDLEIAERIQLNLASVFNHIGNQEFAIRHLTMLLRIREKRDDYGALFVRYAGNLASHYVKVNRDSAFAYYRIALLISRKNKDSIAVASAYNNLGMFRADEAMWEEAFSYYKRAIEVLRGSSDIDSLLLIGICDNIVDYHMHQKDTSSAVELIHKNLNYLCSKEPTASDIYKRTIRYGLKLSKIYFGQHDLNSVEEILQKIRPHLVDDDSEWKIENAIKIKEFELLIAKKRGNDELTKQFSQELTELGLSYLEVMKLKNASLKDAFQDYKQMGVNREIDRLKESLDKKQEKLDIQTNYLIIISILTTMIVIILLVNYKNNARKRFKKRIEKE